MDAIQQFLASDLGMVVSFSLLFIGISDMAIAKTLFGKKIKELRYPSTIITPEENRQYNKMIDSYELIQKILYAVSAVLILIGIYGLGMHF